MPIASVSLVVESENTMGQPFGHADVHDFAGPQLGNGEWGIWKTHDVRRIRANTDQRIVVVVLNCEEGELSRPA